MNAIAFVLLVAAPTAASAAAEAAVFPITLYEDAQCTKLVKVGINGLINIRTGTCFDETNGVYKVYECLSDKELAVTSYTDDKCTIVKTAKKSHFKFTDINTCGQKEGDPVYNKVSASCGTTMSCTTNTSMAPEEWAAATTCTEKKMGAVVGASARFVPLSVVGVIVAMFFA